VSKLVLLKLGNGSLEQGFPVALQLGEEGRHPVVETMGHLPAAPELQQAYQDWALAYRSLSHSLRLDAEPLPLNDIFQREACQDAARTLTDCLNVWLYADSFRPIREKLLEQLMPSDQVRVVVQTENLDVRRLPWHLWDFCDRYPKSEIALGASMYERVATLQRTKFGVNVLATLGNSSGIDTQTDRQLLEQLVGAEVSFLVEPTRQSLTQELWRQSWDILFFAGHSSSSTEDTPGSRGQIALNRSDNLSLDQLKYALRRVVERGLQVAIFNSCDGLGLARELEDLKIPQIIVMREPVPDRVAHEFLKSFLTAFAKGEPFYLAVREAREILQGIEDEYPCATWLPVICQNPAAIPPTWQALGGDIQTLPIPSLPTQAGKELLQSAKPPALLEAQPTLINDRYQVQRMLGQGGFGRTFLAADTYRFGDLCVLKQFAPTNRSPAVLQRSRELFEREAKVLYQINHPQIPKFLAWFTQEDQLFIVEEFIDGKTYLALLQERQRRDETFSEAEMIQWLKDLLPVLDYLHGINIIHRDISPGNVISPQHRSQPVLIDFGIVKEVASQIWSRQVGNIQALQQASRVGKPGYAPPEQMQLGVCYPCSDLYALGMTALVLLTGRNPQWLFEQHFSQPQWLSQISEPLYPILDKLLAENPRNRYSTAQAVLADLNARFPLTDHPSVPSPTRPIHLSAIEQPTALSQTPSQFQSQTPSQPPNPAPSQSLKQPSLLAEPTSNPLPPQWIEQCERELVRCVGPMAGYILEDILVRQPQLTAPQLIELLTAEIPDARQATQFKAKIAATLQQLTSNYPAAPAVSKSSLASTTSSSLPTPLGKAGAAESAALPLNPEAIARCRKELARQIGPMANCIVDDILAQSPQISMEQFVEAIIAEIPDLRQAEAFRQRIS
jgi:serine/threonine protein kinase